MIIASSESPSANRTFYSYSVILLYMSLYYRFFISILIYYTLNFTIDSCTIFFIFLLFNTPLFP